MDLPDPKADKPDRSDKRDAILHAALDLFGELGFHGTAVPQIAERAKVGAGTIYRYFPSKEAIVNEVYRAWKGEMARAVLDGFPAHGPARAQFHHFWSRAMGFALAHPAALRFLELHHHATYLDVQSRLLEEAFIGQAVAVIERSIRDEVIKAMEPWLLMSIVWGALVGLIKAGWENRLELTPKAITDAERCCWEAIRQ